MKRSLVKRISVLVVCICSLFIMTLFTGCTGVNSNTGTNATTLTGSVQSVNTQAGTVTLSINGQTQTISGLSNTDLATLQQHSGKTFTIQVTQTANGFTITANTNPVENDNGQQGTTVASTSQNQSTSGNQPGSISFVGKVQSSNANSVTIIMPNGDTLFVNINAATNRDDFPTQFTNGQQINVSAFTNNDGIFTATELKAVDTKDLQDTQKMSEVDFKAIVISAVGTDSVIHFQIGNKSYNITANSGTQVKGFTSIQGIQANQAVKLTIQYNGSNGNLLKIDSSSD